MTPGKMNLNSINPTKTDLKKFVLLMNLVVGGVIGLILPLTSKKDLRIWPFVVCVLLVGLWFLAPKILARVYQGWMLLGHALGYANSRIILFLFFFLCIAPLRLLKGIFSKDEFPKNWDKNLKTYRKIPTSQRGANLERTF